MNSQIFTDKIFSNINQGFVEKNELSHGQKSLWLKYKQFPESSAYNEGFSIKIRQAIDLYSLNKAVELLVEKHPILRARFEQIKGNVYQIFDGNHEYYEFEDAFLWNDEYLNDHISGTFNYPFSLEQGRVFRVAIYKLAVDEYILVLSAHHIVCDGWSVMILLSELFDFLRSKTEILIDNNYNVFIEEQNLCILSEKGEKIKQYWQQRLTENIITIDLPKEKTDHPKGLLKQITKKVSEKNYRKIERFAKENQVSIFVVLLASYQILLGRYCRQSKVISGVPFLNRTSAKFADSVGFFVNTLPILNHIDNQQSFLENVKILKSTTYEAHKFQNYPLDKIYESILESSQEKLELENYFIFQSSTIHLDKIELLRSGNENLYFDFKGFSVSPYRVLHQQENKLPIQVEAVRLTDGLQLFLQYDISNIENGVLDDFLNHYEIFSCNLIENFDKPLHELSFLTISEEQRLIKLGRGEQTPFDLQRSYANQLFDIVEKYPDHVALRFDDQKLTYAELWENAGKIMNFLKNNSYFADNQVVGVRMNRGIDWITSIVGIFRAGGVYMPIDIDIPIQRIGWMLEDTHSKIILTDQTDQAIDEAIPVKTILESTDKPTNDCYPNLEGIAYIIYTSGSTGKPKGAVVKEIGMLNHHHSRINQLKICAGKKVVQSASMSFDISMWQALSGLLIGAETIIIGKEDILSPKEFWSKIIKQKAQILQVVPTYLAELVNVLKGEIIAQLSNLELVCTIGEVLQPEVVSVIQTKLPHIKVVNMYGPTEASDTVTQFDIHEVSGSIPIGRPIENIQIYLLDDTRNLCPMGTKGEICIGGIGVGKGYINREAQTAQAFIEDPFRIKGTIYRTGDIGRWNHDGLLEYHGRGDHQIKHRGYRIELGEIERQLKAENGIKQAVVIKKGENLIGFISVGAEGLLGGISAIKQRLAEKLPKYMLPSAIYEIDAFPLTVTGKIDRSKIIIPDKINTNSDEIINETERVILDTFKKVLKTNELSLLDNFFEVGGDSILAMRAIGFLADFGYDLDIKSIFDAKNLAQLSREIQQAISTQKNSQKQILENKQPLSEGQKSLWLQQQRNLETTSYNEGFAIRIHQKIDVEKLGNVIKQIVYKNPTLRTRFEEIGGEVYQIIINPNQSFELIDASSYSVESLKSEINHSFNQIFNLEKGEVFRVKLYKVSENESILLVCSHHIVTDGWSNVLLLSEILKNYSENIKVERSDTSYFEFIQEQDQASKSSKKSKYWLQKLSAKINSLDLPQLRKIENTSSESTVKFLNTENVIEIEKFAKSKNLSVSSILLACFQVLLSRYGRQKNIITGIPVANRVSSKYENTIGNFVNTLPILSEICENENFEQLLNKVKNTLAEGLSNQDFPFSKIYETLASASSQTEKLLLESYFSFQASNSDQEIIRLLKSGNPTNPQIVNGVFVSSYEDLHQKHSKFPIHLEVIHTQAMIKLHLKIEKGTIENNTFDNFLNHFEVLVEKLIKNSTEKISEISQLTEAETIQILNLGKGEIVNYNINSFIDQLQKQVQNSQDSIAIRFGNRQISYQQLWDSAGSVANFIVQQPNFERNKIVGVRMQRNIEWLVSLVGILRAGGTYLPIDVEIPLQRIDWMLEDTESEIVIIEKGFEVNNVGFEINTIFENYSSNFEGNQTQPNPIPYIIYTSGSTGKPKGAKVKEVGMLNHLHSRIERFGLKQGTRVAQTASMSFDISIWQSLAPLLAGSEVVIISREEVLSAERFFNALSDQKINIFQAVPTYLAELLKYLESESISLPDLTHLVSSAEVLQPSMVENWRKSFPNSKIFNMYGPTEASDIVVDFEIENIDNLESFPIGKPIENVEIYLLDSSKNLVSHGLKGEICIGGVCVGDGYINRTEQTEKVFVDNPFRPNEKLYRTGDIGRWNQSNDLEYLGRADFQIKHKGYRIELGEIERQILEEKGIMQVVVVKRDENLYAFVTINSSLSEENLRSIRQNLASKLPFYMIPSGIFVVESFPQTISGKIDRSKLVVPENSTSIHENLTESEKEILAIFEDILGLKNLSIKQNFFEVGGDSIRAMRVIGALAKKGHSIEAKEIFMSQNFAEIIGIIEAKAKKSTFRAIERIAERQSYSVSPSQKRMWFMDKFENNNLSAFNSSQAWIFNGIIQQDSFRKAIERLIQRHDILRSNFITIDNEPQLVINQNISLEKAILFTDLAKTNNSVAKFNQIIADESIKTFDLAKDCLFRIQVISVNPTQSVILFVIHHIISDGWSAALMFEEIIQNYQVFIENQEPNQQPLSIQFQDYSAWLETELQTEKLLNSKHFWLNKFSGEIPSIQLPTDFTRPKFKTYNSLQIKKILDENLSISLREYAKSTQKSLFSIVFGAISTLLHRYTGQGEIVIGTPIAGRDHPQLQEQIGLYMNVLPIKLKFEEQSLKQIVDQVSHEIYQAYQHQSYPFEQLIEELKLSRDTSRSPLFDVLIASEEFSSIRNINNHNFSLEQYETGISPNKYDLSFYFHEAENQMELSVGYNVDLFKQEKVKQILDHVESIFRIIIKNDQQKTTAFNYLSEREYQSLVIDFNNTIEAYSSTKTLNQLFEEQVAKTPKNEAIRKENLSISYEELNNKSNFLAKQLIDSGVRSGDNVGLISNRDFDMIAGMLGILKAGGAYVPIDPKYPTDRQRYIIENSKIQTILIGEGLNTNLTFSGTNFSFVSTTEGFNSLKKYSQPNIEKSTNDLAYIIYTSGSSGLPKGVMIEHHSAVNLVEWVNKNHNSNTETRLLCVTSMCFDLSVYDIFGTLSAGGCIVLAEQDDLQNISRLKKILIDERISFWDSVPSTFDMLVGELENSNEQFIQNDLKTIFLSGDWIPVSLPTRFKKFFPNAQMISLGGATEGTVWSNAYPVNQPDSSWVSVPYGKPIANNFFYVLDDNQMPVPKGIIGELYIGGVGVARGYFNDTERTEKAFVEDKFIGNLGGKMYKTGDLGRIMPDGNMEFLGRKDFQVKIRGFRVELGEIEANILNIAEIEQVAVVAQTGSNNQKYLVAFYTSIQTLEANDIKKIIAQKIPDYMIPSHLIRLEQLPLNTNGKIDRKALLAINPNDFVEKVAYEAPKNEVEKQVAEVCEEVIGNGQIGIKENLFTIGLDSLKAIRVNSKLNEKFAASLEIREIFSNPTIEGLASILSNQHNTNEQFELQVIDF